jgi:hypothetical protein
MEMNKTVLIFLILGLTQNEGPKRKAVAMELVNILTNHPERTISLEAVHKHEDLTARQKTWVRESFDIYSKIA